MSLPSPVARPRVRRAYEVQELFERQRTPSAELPDPRPLIESLSRGAIEVIAGVREPEQLARWVDEEPFRTLLIRANLAKRARSSRGQPARQPMCAIRTVRVTFPDDGVAETVVIAEMPARSRAIALRLEGFDGRWRATALTVL